MLCSFDVFLNCPSTCMPSSFNIKYKSSIFWVPYHVIGCLRNTISVIYNSYCANMVLYFVAKVKNLLFPLPIKIRSFHKKG